MTDNTKKSRSLPLVTRILNPVAKYYFQCTEETQRAMRNLSSILLFTVIVCGGILAASICKFCFDGNYLYFPLFFIFAILLYYFIDKPIVFSNSSRSVANLRKARVIIALVFGLLNSFLVDSFFFAKDIKAARIAEMKTEENNIRADYFRRDSLAKKGKEILAAQIDEYNRALSSKRDSLDSEAGGFSLNHKKGLGEIWRSKHANYLADSVSKAALIDAKLTEIARIDSVLQVSTVMLNNEIGQIPDRYSEGINKSIELLHKVVFLDGNFTNILMAILWLIIAMIMELIPLLSKGFYDISEYFEKSANQKDVKDKEATLVKNKELNLIGRKVVLEYKTEEFRMTKRYHEEKVDATIEHNKTIHFKTVSELDRIQALDEKMKQKYPAYYESHIKPMIKQSYLNVHNAVHDALAQP